MKNKLFENQKDKEKKVESIIQKIENAPADKKSQVIVESMQILLDLQHQDLADKIVAQSARAESDLEYRKSLKLRKLSDEEKQFYTNLVKADPKQSVTANQIDIIPTTIVDMTLAELHEQSDLLDLVNFGPATVSKWIVANASGKYAWSKLTAALADEIAGEFTVLNYELGKLYTLLILPKPIRELSLEFVDKYFMALLNMNMYDGLEYGYLLGDGNEKPIGIFKMNNSFNSDGTAKDKKVSTDITGFSPAQLKSVRKTLTHGGKRVVSELHLICNPLDEAEYIDPALYGEKLGGGYEFKSFVPIIKHPTINCPLGKAAFTIKGYYTYGVSSITTDEYRETKALDDADVIISKCYANGRATDDDVAVIFDVTKLEEYIPKYLTVVPNDSTDTSGQ